MNAHATFGAPAWFSTFLSSGVADTATLKDVRYASSSIFIRMLFRNFLKCKTMFADSLSRKLQFRAAASRRFSRSKTSRERGEEEEGSVRPSRPRKPVPSFRKSRLNRSSRIPSDVTFKGASACEEPPWLTGYVRFCKCRALGECSVECDQGLRDIEARAHSIHWV